MPYTGKSNCRRTGILIVATLSKGSYIEHERTLRQFKKACNPKDLTVIDYQMLEKFRTFRIANDILPATVNKSLRTL